MGLPDERIVQRRLLPIVRERLGVEIVVGLQGARSVGKSTLLRQIAAESGGTVIDLDDPEVRGAVATDPGLFVRGRAPVCIDEFQHVPLVLDAIKAELNKEQRPGRFVITGSTRFEALPLAAQSLTGRLHMLTIRPLSQGELAGVPEDFLARCLSEPESLGTYPPSSTTRTEYIERVTAGGMPMALQRPAGAARNRWFDDFVNQTIERDVMELSKVRQRAKVPQLLARLAGQTAQVLNISVAGASVDIEQRTADNYAKLLEAVFLISRLPAWGTTLRARSAAAPKVHVVDSGVAARLLRLGPDRLAALEPSALTEFGHLLETFVVGELLKQASWLDDIIGTGHWRTHDGDEVDLVIERGDGRVLGFEVRAAGRVQGAGLRGLRRLRDAVGDRFLAGVMLYTGELCYTADERLYVVPIDRLWARAGA